MFSSVNRIARMGTCFSAFFDPGGVRVDTAQSTQAVARPTWLWHQYGLPPEWLKSIPGTIGPSGVGSPGLN